MKNKIFIYGYLIMSFVGGIFVLIKMVCMTPGKDELIKQI